MKIETRDPSLKYPRAIKAEKVRLVLDWLLEFRFSSIGLLARRIGSTPINSNRFFNQLIDDQLIQVIKNAHTNYERYVMLTYIGASYLEAHGRSIDRAIIKITQLERYSKILHDIAVQYAVLNRLEKYDEVIWDNNIELPDQLEKPDALLHSPRGYWAALEYERWRKDNRRIYMAFMKHVQAFEAGHYKGVFFLFEQEIDLLHYKKLFDAKEWRAY